MWRFTPKISWNKTIPGPLPAGGSERYAPYLPPPVAAMSIHWELIAVLVEGSRGKFGKRFGARGMRHQRGIARRRHFHGIVVLAEAPRTGDGDIGGIDAIALKPGCGSRRGFLQLGERGV